MVSISACRVYADSVNVLRPTEIPLSVFPRTMPSSGMRYCGWYHLSMPVTTKNNANDVTNQLLIHTERSVSNQMPLYRRRFR